MLHNIEDVVLEEYVGENYLRKDEIKTQRKLDMEIALKESALKTMKYLTDYSENFAKTFNQMRNNGIDKNKFTSRHFTGKLKDYQVEGVQWLINLYENGMSGILGDEMGLGKTIQTVALFCHVYEKTPKFPSLITCPLSTLPHWKNEFRRFAPKLPFLVCYGNKKERASMKVQFKKLYLLNGKPVPPIIIIPYHYITSDKRIYREISWQYFVVDEGQRLKNGQSQISKILNSCNSVTRLLLTGTPIQNNLSELWSLLHFLMPNVIKNKYALSTLIYADDFSDKNKILNTEKETNILNKIQKVLQPFMLRRLKCDVLDVFIPKKEALVYCRISPVQKQLYKFTVDLRKKINAGIIDDEFVQDGTTVTNGLKRSCRLRNKEKDAVVKVPSLDPFESYYKEIRNKIGSTWLLLRQIVNHPYALYYPVESFSYKIDANLVTQSGKMLVLDSMLEKLKKQKHKVLIYCTSVKMLNIIEAYLDVKDYMYCRLDGNSPLEERDMSIAEFNKNPDIFVFILSTRAGGLGINLTAADTVIFFDRDWNPQVDIQAQNRCHRIGQTKPVMVFTLITKNTIDEKILSYGSNKLKLEKVLIQKDKFNMCNKDFEQHYDLEELARMLEEDDVYSVDSMNLLYSDEELDKLLDRSDLYREMKKRAKNN